MLSFTGTCPESPALQGGVKGHDKMRTP